MLERLLEEAPDGKPAWKNLGNHLAVSLQCSTMNTQPHAVTYAHRNTPEELATLTDEQLEARVAELGELGERSGELFFESGFGVVYEWRVLRGRVQWEMERRVV